MTPFDFALVGIALASGALSQRITGMGFGLVSIPLLVLVLGPAEGVLLANVAAAVSAAVMLATTSRDIDWEVVSRLALPTVVGLVPGLVIIVIASGPVLAIIVGSSVLVALTASLIVARHGGVVSHAQAAWGAGSIAGFMSVLAGLGGPGLAAYRVLTDWDQRAFAASIQPLFLGLNVLAVGLKLLTGTQLPGSPIVAALALSGILLGHLAGLLVAHRLSVRVVKSAVLVVAYAGAASVVASGVAALAHG